MSTEKHLNNLIINEVENQEVYDYMVSNDLINEDELYLVRGDADVKIAVDPELSATSENPVQNKVITAEINNLNELVGDTSVASQITTAISSKVDKIDGKSLSTNDYSTAEKNKLAGIAEGAEVNVKSNWTVTDTNSDAFIMNKPSIDNGAATHSIQEGYGTSAMASYSHAEGLNTVTRGNSSHVEGQGTVSIGRSQHIQGEYNIQDSLEGNPYVSRSTYAHILGNGTSDTARSNAHTIDWSGNAWFAGTVKIGGTGQDDETANELATKEYVDNSHPTVDDTLSSTSTNAVQNKVVNTAITNLQTLVGDTSVSTQITNAVEAKLDKDDCAWTQIYDSGAITTAVNAISGINVSGYKSLKVAIKCVNTTANSTTAGGAIVFTCENGQDYVFANILGNLIRNTASTSGGAADFKVLDNYLACECSYRALNAENMLSDEEGAGADNLTTLCGGCYIKCTSPISTMMITNATQSDSLFYGVGSRVVVWGCKV